MIDTHEWWKPTLARGFRSQWGCVHWCEGGGGDAHWSEGDSEWLPAALTGKRLHSFLCIVLNGRKRLCKLECDLKSEIEEANLDLDSKHQCALLKGLKFLLPEVRRMTSLASHPFLKPQGSGDSYPNAWPWEKDFWGKDTKLQFLSLAPKREGPGVLLLPHYTGPFWFLCIC